jgi:hypothetical protein
MQTDAKQAANSLDLIHDTLVGLATVLGTTLVSKGQPALTILSPASIAAQREQFRVEGKVQYPYCEMSVTGFNKIHNQSYNDSLRRSGINVAQKNNTYLNYRLTPVMLNINIKYSCQSFYEQLNFSTQWHLAEKISQFRLKNEALELNIQNIFSPELSLAELNFGEAGNIFTIETSLTSSTYIGEYIIKPKITKFDALLNLGTSINPGLVEEVLPILPKES